MLPWIGNSFVSAEGVFCLGNSAKPKMLEEKTSLTYSSATLTAFAVVLGLASPTVGEGTVELVGSTGKFASKGGASTIKIDLE
jgi:hypothetical protein